MAAAPVVGATRWTRPGSARGAGWYDGWAEPVLTAANAVTAARTAVAVLATLAWAVTGADGTGWLWVSLAAYWAGDIADGAVARAMRQETRRGAVLDVVCDRVCALAFYVPWAITHPDVVVPVVLYLLVFCGIDLVVSLRWRRWPVLSPNDFHVVDTRTYRLCWWPPVKALNTAATLGLLVLVPSPVPAVIGVLLLGTLKVWALGRLVRLG